jgi:hypothetical protein
VKIVLGANFFNVLNHPNFISPNANRNSGAFGSIEATAEGPSSPYGNFQGAAASGRMIQTLLKIQF